MSTGLRCRYMTLPLAFYNTHSFHKFFSELLQLKPVLRYVWQVIWHTSNFVIRSLLYEVQRPSDVIRSSHLLLCNSESPDNHLVDLSGSVRGSISKCHLTHLKEWFPFVEKLSEWRNLDVKYSAHSESVFGPLTSKTMNLRAIWFSTYGSECKGFAR